jgi:hypothetical protein
MYVLGQVNANVLALAAAESRLKIWGTDLFPAGSGEQVERPDNWGRTSLHRILGAADDTDREYRGVVSEDGSALTKMSASMASKDGVEITPSAVSTHPVVKPVPAEEENVQLKGAMLPELLLLRQQKRQQEARGNAARGKDSKVR